ncbi:MAG TPA: hypothetical protein VNL74_03870 [Methylococcus sp.]|nr:hypothetical protein [Methylococcus sp.]
MDEIKLSDIAAVLGCSKPAASLLRSGKYDKGGERAEDLKPRYEALLRIVAEAEARGRTNAAGSICLDCPREDCSGCRVAEIVE